MLRLTLCAVGSAVVLGGSVRPAAAQLAHEPPRVSVPPREAGDTGTGTGTGTGSDHDQGSLPDHERDHDHGREHDHDHGRDHEGDHEGGHDKRGGHGHGIGGLAIGMIAGSTELFGKIASYETLVAHGHLHLGPVMISGHAPAHRLESSGGVVYGIGDVHLDATLVLHRPGFLVGAGVGVGLPTGSRADRLGMGHAMLMPSLVAGARVGALEVIAVGSYRRALGEADHAGHGGTHVVVAPMSLEEIEAMARALWWVSPSLAALGEVGVAFPLVDDPVRAAAATGVRWHRGRLDIDALVGLGVAGEPYLARGSLNVHVTL